MHYSEPIWSPTEDLNRGLWYNPMVAILIINDTTWVIHSKFCFILSHLGFQGKNAGVLGSMNKFHQPSLLGFLGDTSGKEPTCQWRRHKSFGFDPWVRKISWRRVWQPTPVFLPGELPWTEEPDGLQFIGSQNWTWLKWLSTHPPTLSGTFLKLFLGGQTVNRGGGGKETVLL